jgi:hypothetical protein
MPEGGTGPALGAAGANPIVPTPNQGGGGSAATGTDSGGAGTSAGGSNDDNAAGRGGAAGTSGGVGGATPSGGGQGTAGAALVDACGLPNVVRFKQDLEPFLSVSCGGGNGCHVIDNGSTVSAGGYDHAYDWLTAGSHSSSCPDTPFRFEIVLDVIREANPATCSRSRQMPPPDETGANLRTPLTDCQVAALAAWLAEPYVTQMHRSDDTSPSTPYAMPPFN